MPDPSLSLATDRTALEYDCREECFLEPVPDGEPAPRIILVAIGAHGEVSTVCTNCIEDRIVNPEIYPACTFHGTHVLSEAILMDLFPEEYED
jgi:hypothetical protein